MIKSVMYKSDLVSSNSEIKDGILRRGNTTNLDKPQSKKLISVDELNKAREEINEALRKETTTKNQAKKLRHVKNTFTVIEKMNDLHKALDAPYQSQDFLGSDLHQRFAEENMVIEMFETRNQQRKDDSSRLMIESEHDSGDRMFQPGNDKVEFN